MKKFLYCAAVVALAAACTQEDDLLNNAPSSQAQGQGLTFEATLANNNVGTKVSSMKTTKRILSSGMQNKIASM